MRYTLEIKIADLEFHELRLGTTLVSSRARFDTDYELSDHLNIVCESVQLVVVRINSQ